MTEAEFWDSTPRFLSARQKAYTRGVHLSWEQTRFLSYTIFKTVDSKNRIRKPEDVCKFPWETDVPKFVPQTKEQLQVFSDEADEILRITQPEVYKTYMEAKLNAQNGSTTT
jgi:hypothetical protein